MAVRPERPPSRMPDADSTNTVHVCRLDAATVLVLLGVEPLHMNSSHVRLPNGTLSGRASP